MNAVDSIREYNLIIVTVVIDNTKLYKGTIYKDKETLHNIWPTILLSRVMHHMKEVESTPTKWSFDVRRRKKVTDGDFVQ